MSAGQLPSSPGQLTIGDLLDSLHTKLVIEGEPEVLVERVHAAAKLSLCRSDGAATVVSLQTRNVISQLLLQVALRLDQLVVVQNRTRDL